MRSGQINKLLRIRNGRKNAAYAKYLSNRSRARTFIRFEVATEDLDEIARLISRKIDLQIIKEEK